MNQLTDPGLTETPEKEFCFFWSMEKGVAGVIRGGVLSKEITFDTSMIDQLSILVTSNSKPRQSQPYNCLADKLTCKDTYLHAMKACL